MFITERGGIKTRIEIYCGTFCNIATFDDLDCWNEIRYL